MERRESVSEQLKRRRRELGMSLSDVARRAGTSAATLSRYEHGWTRFGLYTLEKLAVSLNCELRIKLEPAKAAASKQKQGRAKAVARLKRLFWDHPLADTDLEEHLVWVVERVLDYGNLDDIAALRATMGTALFLDAVARAGRLSPRTRSLWSRILEMEGVPCTKARSRATAWNS